MKFSPSTRTAVLALTAGTAAAAPTPYFRRASTFPVCLQESPTCDTDLETVAETLWFLPGGAGLVYTDSEQKRLGFVDVSDAAAPGAAGTVDLGGEPTTVRVVGGHGESRTGRDVRRPLLRWIHRFMVTWRNSANATAADSWRKIDPVCLFRLAQVAVSGVAGCCCLVLVKTTIGC